ncbi:MAG TPA: hypothetical protein VIW72_09395 [Burkholderiales bacterium]
MNDEPVQINRGGGVTEERDQKNHKRNLKEIALDETKKMFVIFIYLFILFGLLSLYEWIILAKHQISYRPYGFAIINALVLAKVMLIAEDLNLGGRFFKDRPLVYPILFKSMVFAIVLICFHIVEHVIVGVWDGKAIIQSIPGIGGGGLKGILAVGMIMFVALIPFFAFKEISRAVGERELYSLIFTGGTKIEKLQSKGQ